jgi:hypothetical protein
MSDGCSDALSACVIWPIFSSSVMRASRSAARCSGVSDWFLYGSWRVPRDCTVASTISVTTAVRPMQSFIARILLDRR